MGRTDTRTDVQTDSQCKCEKTEKTGCLFFLAKWWQSFYFIDTEQNRGMNPVHLYTRQDYIIENPQDTDFIFSVFGQDPE